ncbi:MAG TPA: cytochrome P450 [Beijerinckiaceae bacterium]|nr:cytochrome P450 [Beijerinckiaceae bacterium]
MQPYDESDPDWPPAPTPNEKPLGLLRLLATLWRNPLEAWTQAHFEEPIVIQRAPFGEVAVVSDPPSIRRILIENVENYQKDSLQRRILGAAMREGLLTAEGDRWREQRRALSQIFSRRTVTGFAAAMAAAVRAVSERWRAAPDGATHDIAQEMARLTLDVLVRTVFSDGFGEDPDTIRAAMQRYFEAIGRIDPFDILGLPDAVPRPLRASAWSAGRVFDRAVDAIIAKRAAGAAARASEHRAPDLLDLLLAARDPESGRGLSEAEVRANIITFIAAGHETTSNALTWTLYLLSCSHEWRERVLREAEAAAQTPAEELEARLPVTRAVIDESVRLYPPLVAISRQAIGPDCLAGLPIEPGTFVVIAPYILHRHRKLWDRPNAFDPTRFLQENRRSIDKCAYLPFGVGPRVCIGSAFALQEATIALAEFTREFVFQSPPGRIVRPLHRVTLKPAGGLPMRVFRRKQS